LAWDSGVSTVSEIMTMRALGLGQVETCGQEQLVTQKYYQLPTILSQVKQVSNSLSLTTNMILCPPTLSLSSSYHLSPSTPTAPSWTQAYTTTDLNWLPMLIYAFMH
jgi:hypothetical protein